MHRYCHLRRKASCIRTSCDMDDLSIAALRYMTDKAPYDGDLGTYHFYTPRYHELFAPIRESVRRVLEIGVQHGASLRMWRDYFYSADIYGIDIDATSFLRDEPRITTLIGDATNPATLHDLASRGPWDIIIDDGSHNLDDMRDTCLALYPHTLSVYVIEDVHMEWWGPQLEAALRPMAGEPEKIISRTGAYAAAYVYDKRVPRV